MTARSFIFPVLLSVSLLAVAGCCPVYFVSDVPEELEILAEGFVAGEITRDELHADLGQPLVVSEDATVEVFRAASGHDVGTLVWLGPIPPLPFPPFSGRGDVTGYLMVRYDSVDVVRETATGFTADWEPEYKDRGDHRELTLSLLPYEFYARYRWPTYQESLFVALPNRWPPLPSDKDLGAP